MLINKEMTERITKVGEVENITALQACKLTLAVERIVGAGHPLVNLISRAEFAVRNKAVDEAFVVIRITSDD